MVSLIITVHPTGILYMHIKRLLFSLNVIVFYRPFSQQKLSKNACFTEYNMHENWFDPLTVELIAMIPLVVTRELLFSIFTVLVFIDTFICSTQL